MSISLDKNTKISLSKEAKNSLTSITVGLGWDPVKSKGFLASLFGGDSSIDLDASCVLFDGAGNEIDTVWFRKLNSSCRSVMHSGDNMTGEGDGDDESIKVDLAALPKQVEHIGFTVNSFRGQTFDKVENCYCRVVDQSGKELVRYNLREQGAHTGVYIALLSRSNGEWNFTAQGIPARGRDIGSIIPDIKASL